MTTADFNGDGKLDLATADSTAGTASVLLGTGDGTFGAPTSFPAGAGAHALVASDLNGDGKLDLAIANSTGNSVSVLLGNGAGAFQAARPFRLPAARAR